MQIPTRQIDLLLQEQDIEGLIESGAPNDEYHSEAQDIAKALQEFNNTELTQENILGILVAIWAKSFNLQKNDLERRLSALTLTAQKISEMK